MIRDSSPSHKLSAPKPLEHDLKALLPEVQKEYQAGVNRDLARHRYQGVFSRRLLITSAILLSETEHVIADYLKQCAQGRKEVLEEAETLVSDLLEIHTRSALQHNRNAVSLADYPEEQSPSEETFSDVLSHLEELRQHWRTQIHKAA